MLEKFKKNALSNEQMKNVKGGVAYVCQCNSTGNMYSCSGNSQAQIACKIEECGSSQSATCYPAEMF